MDYATLVLQLLNEKKYPILEEYVVIDIYYKMIPIDHPSTTVIPYDRRFHNPEDVYIRDAKPFQIHYMVCVGDNTFYTHYVDKLQSFPTKCITIRLNRSYLDESILLQKNETFEEEIYKFITLLNFDVPKIARVLNLGFFESTRFMPQRIKLWVFKHSVRNINYQPLSETDQACFGPNEGAVPIRVIAGRLSECQSRSTLLSLNDLSDQFKFTQYYSTRWKTLVPLAFNPLENPIVI